RGHRVRRAADVRCGPGGGQGPDPDQDRLRAGALARIGDTGGMTPDPFLWLEEVTGDDAMAWVRERNAETVAELTGSTQFEQTRDEIRAVFDADDRIPYVRRRG